MLTNFICLVYFNVGLRSENEYHIFKNLQPTGPGMFKEILNRQAQLGLYSKLHQARITIT